MGRYFEFFCPVKILSGHAALENIPFELEQLKGTKPLLITDKGVTSAGLIHHLIGAFKESSVSIAAVFDDVPADSSLSVVKEISQLYKEAGCDSIIAVGGGSVIDTAKGVNIIVSENASDLMSLTGAGALTRKLKPLIVIPTTSGTGSEVTMVAVIADKENSRKMIFSSHFLLPDIAVIDSRMTMTLPPHITAATGMDALTHAVEAYICLGKNCMSDAYAFSAIKLISENLLHVVAHPSDAEGRLALGNAATMAGIAFSNSMVGMVHTIGHSVGAVCHVPHGVAMSILLPYALEYNLTSAADSIGELLLPLSGADVYAAVKPSDRAAGVIEDIYALREKLYTSTGGKLPRTLRETGRVAEEHLPHIAQLSLGDGSIVYNPEELDYEDILAVLKKAF